MFYPFYIPDPTPPKPPPVGSFFRRRGDTLDWEVVFTDDVVVKLRGPGHGKGIMIVSIEDLNKNYVRV